MKWFLASDLHLRGERPRARLDEDWLQTQKDMLLEIGELCGVHDVNGLILVGDIFDHPRVSTEVLNMTVGMLQNPHIPEVFVVAGNHDLVGHNIENLNQCSIGVLRQVFSGPDELAIRAGNAKAWDFNTEDPSYYLCGVQYVHQLIFKDEKSRPPTDKGRTADELLDYLPHAKWIFCGDMHQHFHHTRTDNGIERHVVNMGLTIRQKASELAYEPSVVLFDDEAETVERLKLTDDPAMVTREHLEVAEAREGRIDAFMEKMSTTGAVTLSFMDNLEAKIATTDLEPDVAFELNEIINLTKQESK